MRKIGSDKYQIWLPEPDNVTKVRISDFILQQRLPNKEVDCCNNKDEPEEIDREKKAENQVKGNRTDPPKGKRVHFAD